MEMPLFLYGKSDILYTMKTYRIFVINPGSTSTKLAMFENDEKQFDCDVFHDSTILRQFPSLNDQVDYRMEVIQEFLKDNGMAYLRMDPYVEYQQLNTDGSITGGGFNNQDIIDFLESLGYEHLGFTKNYTADSQVRYMVVLDLDDKDDAAITAGYEPNTRRTINRARKFGVEIEECAPDNLDEFMELMEFTSEKRHFIDLGLESYQAQMNAFGKDCAKV